jgi:hypothetical protein
LKRIQCLFPSHIHPNHGRNSRKPLNP